MKVLKTNTVEDEVLEFKDCDGKNVMMAEVTIVVDLRINKKLILGLNVTAAKNFYIACYWLIALCLKIK